MSYGKKDEDADGAILKVDRTAVFQEGLSMPTRTDNIVDHQQLVSSTTLPYRLGNVGYFSRRSPSYSLLGSPSPPMKPLIFSLAFPSYFKIKTPHYGK